MTPVTIYVVCNNHRDFARQAIESVANQTYGNLEVIVFDNGSTDGSVEVLRSLRDTHGFRLVEQANVGLVATIISAYRLAKGDYVVRLDADDWLEPEAVEKLVAALDSAPDVAMAFPDYYEVGADGRIVRRIRRRTFDDAVTLLDQPAHGAVTLTRKSAYFDVGGVDPRLTAQDGFDLWLKVTRKYRVRNVAEPLFYYRRHEANLTNDLTRILQQRHAIYRNHSGELDPAHYLGVIVLPKVKDGGELFLKRTFGKTTLLQRAVAKLAQSTVCRSAAIVCPEDQVGDAEQVVRDAALETRVFATPPASNGYHEVGRILDSYPGVRNLIFVSPQNPFMYLNYIDAMIYYKELFPVNSVHSCQIDNHLLFQHDGKTLALFNDGFERRERDLIVRKAGGLMLVDAAEFRRLGHGLAEPIGHIEIDEVTGFEVGSPISLEAAAALAQIW